MKEIFIASAKEASRLDALVKAILEGLNVKPVGWHKLARASESFLDRLIQTYPKVDGIILLLTPDDMVTSRGAEMPSPRDNIVLEIGMAISALGRERIFVASFCNDSVVFPKKPTVLDGMEVKSYSDKDREYSELKADISQWIESLHHRDRSDKIVAAIDSSLKALKQYSETSEEFHESIIQKYVLKRLEQNVDALVKNEIILTQTEYFAELKNEINSASKDVEILAVAKMPVYMWQLAPGQILYAQNNLLASAKGAKIRRLFVYPDKHWAQIHKHAKEQVKAGIDVRRVSISGESDMGYLEDIVIFKRKDGTTRGYIADIDLYSPSRISQARMILKIKDSDPRIVAFNQAWALARRVRLTTETINKPSIFNIPPGESMELHRLESEVITLEQAAIAKGIALSNELKTLILITSEGPVALHLRGDKEPNMSEVKRRLRVAEVYPLPIDKLKEPPLNLMPGTVSALLDPVWSMPHLISSSLLELKKISANAGTLNSYYYFSPQVLLDSEVNLIGNFDCP